MHILTVWGLRKQRENAVRSFTAVFALSCAYALLSRSTFIVEAMIREDGAAGGIHSGGMLSIITNYIWQLICAASLVMLVSIFSVTVRECMEDYRLLHTAGATKRQVVRSLMARAFALDVLGAVVGVAVGVALSSLSLEGDVFAGQLPYFFRETRTIATLLTEFAIVPVAMLLACVCILPPNKRRRLRKPKHRMFARSWTRRIFGVGGVIGRLSGRGIRLYRAVFTLALAVNVAVTALLCSACSVYARAQSGELEHNVEVSYAYHPARTQTFDSRISDALRAFEASGAVDYSFTPREIYLHFAYTLIPDEWVSREMRTAQAGREWSRERSLNVLYPVRNGGMQMVWTPTSMFLPNELFLHLCEKNGIEPRLDGALLCNTAETRYRMLPILSEPHPSETVGMYALPKTFRYEKGDSSNIFFVSASDGGGQSEGGAFDPDDFLREAESAAETVRFPIVGLLAANPISGTAYGIPILFFPQQMYDLFAPVMREEYLSIGIPDGNEDSREVSLYISAPEHEKVCARLLEIAGREDCQIVETKPGTGLAENNKQFMRSLPDEGAACYLRISDFASLEHGNNAIRARWLPALNAAVVWMTGAMLVAGVLNIVHLYRILRRHEDAILASLGMGARHRRGMHLYDGVRCTLQSISLSILLFFASYSILFRRFILYLSSEGLRAEGAPYMHASSTSYMFVYTMQSSLRSFGRFWWVFAVAGVSIFGVYLFSALWIDRRIHRDDLIRILKNDF